MTAAVREPAEGYLLVESQSGHPAELFLADGLALARAGRRVRVLLVSDGVAAAVGPVPPAVAGLLAAGGEVWVDDFTLAQRAIPAAALVAGAAVVGMDRIADLLADDRLRAVWH